LVVPEFSTQAVTGMGGAGAVELRQPARDCGSHSSNHSDCCGGGSVNESPTYCTGKPYWGAIEKPCDVGQDGALPMGGSKDIQAGYTEKPYWGATKMAYNVNQYGAPPMDRSKDGQEGAPQAVPPGVPTTAMMA
jgi:hypothetical protein